MSSNDDIKYISRAMNLALLAKGQTSPNPLVGAVIVRDGRIIAEGYHTKAGAPHAEIEAIRNARGKTEGATLYVTLEPCRHHGKTPPCTEAILAAKLKTVVVGMRDPNPLMRGKSIADLRRAGLNVRSGVMDDELAKINEPFIKYITKKLPYVVAKMAMSLDGRIAVSTGESKWITSELSRKHGHLLRAESDAVIAGIETVLQDDPLLTARKGKVTLKKQPVRVVLDSRLRIQPKSNLLKSISAGKVIIAVTRKASVARKKLLTSLGAEILEVRAGKNGRIDMKALLMKLASRGIASVMIEGGGTVIAGALSAGMVDRVEAFIGPCLIGGDGFPAVSSMNIRKLSSAVKLEDMEVARIGADILISARVVKK